MSDDLNRGRERTAFTGLVALLLAPVIAQGLWRPMRHLFGPSGNAATITLAALVISGAIVLVGRLRRAHAGRLSCGVGGVVAVAATLGGALGAPGLVTLWSVAAAIALLVQWLPPRLPAALDGLARRHKVLTVLYAALALFVAVKTARVSIFIGDPTQLEAQAVPGVAFLDTHSCLTAYVHAATLSRQRVDNLYADRWWHGAHGLPPLPAGVENPYRPFQLDYYAYPPPFLFVVAPLAPLDGDFLAQRALWFALNGLLLACALWIVARWIDGPGAHRALLLAPLFFGSIPVLVTLEVGNFQIAVVVISILAMVAFHRDRPAIGGALLAFTVLSKLSPGVLGVVLLAQRRWRSALWTAGFGLLLLCLSIVAFGLDPLKSFLTYALPRVSSGEAFAFLDDTPFNVFTNMGPFGLPFKLQLIGLDVGDPWILARRVGRAYTIVIVVLALLATRRRGDRRAQALIWMSLLVLGAMQSPFAPGYVMIGLLWAITLLAVEVGRARDAIALVLLWLVLTFVPSIDSLPIMAAYGLLQSAVAIGAPCWLILRAARPQPNVGHSIAPG